MRAALAVAFLLVSQTAPPGLFYDFEWRSAAMLSRWEGGDDVGRPPAPPHLTSGTFQAVGDPQRPKAFELAWAEGFICRTMPATCGNVTAWSRELTGRATLATP